MGPPPFLEEGAFYHTAPVLRSQPIQLPKIGPKTLGARQLAELSARLAVPKAVISDLSFGEEVVNETLTRHRNRTLDWDRLDVLASPGKRASNCSSWRCEKPDPLLNTGMTGDCSTRLNTGMTADDESSATIRMNSQRTMQETGSSWRSAGAGSQGRASSRDLSPEEHRAKVANLVQRLASPKVPSREPKPTGEKVLDQANEVARNKKIDVHMLVHRLASPKEPPSGALPGGEKLILEAMEKSKRRLVDRSRILFLAAPTKRGASMHSWRSGQSFFPVPDSGVQGWKKSDGYAPLTN
jgi:hypothetical protein